MFPELQWRLPPSPTACGCWDGFFSRITHFCFRRRMLRRQRERQRLYQYHKERIELEQELEMMRREIHSLKKKERKLEKRKRQREMEKQMKEDRERAQWKKDHLQLSKLREKEEKKRKRKKSARQMAEESDRERERDAQDRDKQIRDLEERLRINNIEILRCREKEEELEQELQMLRKIELEKREREKINKIDVERESLLLLEQMQQDKKMNELKWREREEALEIELEKMKGIMASITSKDGQREEERKCEAENHSSLLDGWREEEKLELEERRGEEELKRVEAQIEMELEKETEAILKEMERKRDEERKEMERQLLERQKQIEKDLQRQLKESEVKKQRQKELEREQEERQRQAKERLREMERLMMKERQLALKREESWSEMMKKKEEDWHCRYLAMQRMKEEEMRDEKLNAQEIEMKGEIEERNEEIKKEIEERKQEIKRERKMAVEQIKKKKDHLRDMSKELEKERETTDVKQEKEFQQEIHFKENSREIEKEEQKERKKQGAVKIMEKETVATQLNEGQREMEEDTQKEEELLREDGEQQLEEELPQETVSQSEEDKEKEWKESQLEIQKIKKARQEHMERAMRRKREMMKRMFAPGVNFFKKEEGARRQGFRGRRKSHCLNKEKQEEHTELENKQEKLQQSSWPVGGLISVKPLNPCPEPAEELKDAPSPVDQSIPPTTEDSVKTQKSSTDPAEAEPAQSHTDGSEHKLTTTVETAKEFVLQARQLGSMVKCSMERDKSSKDGPSYHLFQETEDGTKQLLLVAKKVKDKVRTYAITDEADSVLGYLKSNIQRTEFMLYDNGRNPNIKHGAVQGENCLQQELAAVCYESNMAGLRGTSKISAVIPCIDMDLKRIPVYVQSAESRALLKSCCSNKSGNMIRLRTKTPKLNKAGEMVLNFQGRVQISSVKNCQLVCSDNPKEIVMQFGRMDENRFALDYTFPMCAVQAFAIGVSCCDDMPSLR